ncbi:MAG: precorrin-6A reductase [Eubacteriales bacterium]|nr:precorrin-6A reductase [Eubacteriales bacterium]
MDREDKRPVLIFGGTSEGRELAEYAARIQAPVTVSVVSEYGEGLLPEGPYVQVHTGALDERAMADFLREQAPELVLDATHPYAAEVTRQVRRLCAEQNIPCRRVLRDQETGEGGLEGLELFRADSAAEAADMLQKDGRPVLLTTGSKELEQFAEDPALRDRIYPRVLPDSQVLAKCETLGIPGSRIIAMQGPFSVEMNCALLRQANAGWLVTKESGSRGGYREKLEAAAICGASVIVIGRPSQETGISMAEAKQLLRKYAPGRISLIGMGMGGGGQLTREALSALASCDYLLGAKRMLQDAGPSAPQARQLPLYLAEDIAAWLEGLEGGVHVAVVYSGDTGFYSGSRSLLKLLGQKRQEQEQQKQQKQERQKQAPWRIRVFPGISSVSALCGLAETSWEDLFLASGHGRSCSPPELIREHRRVFLLLDRALSLGEVCRQLCRAGCGGVKVTAGIRMGYEDERLLKGRAGEFVETEDPGLTAVILEREDGAYPYE